MKKITFYLFFGLLFLSGIAQAQQTFTWVGSIDESFDNPSNWQQHNAPNRTDGANIKFAVTAKKNLELIGYTVINNLTNSSQRSLVMKGNSLAITGNIQITSIGKIIPDGGTLIMQGSNPQTIPDNAIQNNTLNRLVINNPSTGGVSVDPNFITNQDTLFIEGSLGLSNGQFHTNNRVTFKSTANRDATFTIVQGSSNIIGDVTVERYMSANRGYRFISSPVTTTSSINTNWQEGQHNTGTNYNGGDNKNSKPHFGTHITGAANGDHGFDASPSNNPSLFVYDKGKSPYPFASVPNTDTKTLNAGDPYLLFVRGSRAVNLLDATNAVADTTILRTTGELKFGPVTETFMNPGEFVLFGNPYQATVAMKSVVSGFNGSTASTNINPNFYYVYDPRIGSIGGYKTISIDNSGNKKQYLQPGEAAQFEVLNQGSPVNIQFRESYKGSNEKHQIVPFSNEVTETPQPQITGDLYTTESYNQDGPIYDSFMIRFNNNYSNAIDLMDAKKPFNVSSENMGMQSGGKVYSVESRTMPKRGDQVQLYNDSYGASNYTLLLSVENLNLENVTPHLIDNYTGNDIKLNAGDNTYNFSVDKGITASTANDRFSIHFEDTTLGIDDQTGNASLSIYPNPVQRGNDLFVTTGTLKGEKVHVSVTDVLGKTVYHASPTLTTNRTRINTSSLQSGVYFVSIAHQGKKVTKKLVIQ